MPESVGVYLHIPFCLSKCAYCDFVSRPLRVASELETYIDFLKKELTLRACGSAQTIFWGGGTPSLCTPKQIRSVHDLLAKQMSFSQPMEISLEANPGSLLADRIADFRNAGINRVSIGVQSTSDIFLKKMGRCHTQQDAWELFKAARRYGLHNISCDLIYGMPDQTLEDFQNDLKTLVAWEPDHLSLYALSVETGTPLQTQIQAGLFKLPEDDHVADMYEWACVFLDRCGFQHYELSNFAQPGKECQHNLIYWNNQEYLGVGVGAHSYIQGVRSWNHTTPETYQNALQNSVLPEAGHESLIGRDKIAETLMLGLRLIQGIRWETLENRFGTRWREDFAVPLTQMSQQGLLQEDSSGVRLSVRGRFLSNIVFRALL